MRSIHRHGLLSQALLMLGVVGLPPPPTREQLNAEALAETERVKVDLEAAGLSAAEVVEAVDPERFAKVGRLLLALQKHRRSLGQEPTVGDLLQTATALESAHLRMRPNVESLRDWTPERPEEVAQVTFTTSKGAMVGKTAFLEANLERGPLTMEIAKVDPLCLYSATKPSPSDVWAAICAIPREPRTHNRKAQRASKKARTAAKKRRGW